MEHLLERYTLDRLTGSRALVQVMRQQLLDIPVHWHDFYELVFVLDGQSVHACNGQSGLVSAGSSMLLSPTDFHGFTALSDEPLRCINVVIDPWIIERQLGGLLRSAEPPAAWVVDDFTVALTDFERLWTESTSDLPGADRIMEAVLACILVEFVRRLPQADAGGLAINDDPVRCALFYVDQHFREPLTLAQVAAQVYLSPHYFSERFHDLTGISFQTNLQQCRLRFARSLLAATDVSVADAALAAGFNSPSHFGRAFRARYGCSPTVDRDLAAAGAR